MSENGSKILTFEEILATQQKTEPVKVPLGAGYVLVRCGSMADKAAVEREGRRSDGKGMHPYKTRQALLMRALVNEDGSRMLPDKEAADRLMKHLPAPVLEPIVDAAFQQFGFSDKDVEDVEGN